MPNRLHITVFLGVAALAWLVLLRFRGIPVTWDHAWPFATVITILVVVVAVFNRWAWTWRILQNWFVKRPDLRGTWRVVLETDWVDTETGQSPGPITCYMAIRQTFSTLGMRLMTPESTSWLIAHKIVLTNEGIYQVTGVYINKPQVLLRGERSEIHYGAILLDVEGDPPQSLSGHYWTDRKTRGTMSLADRLTGLFETYESAKDAYDHAEAGSEATSEGRQKMTYHVYENWTVRPKKAKVHFSNCSFCNYGQGTDKPKENGRNGTWLGPFDTFQEAREAARRTGRNVSECGHCRPR